MRKTIPVIVEGWGSYEHKPAAHYNGVLRPAVPKHDEISFAFTSGQEEQRVTVWLDATERAALEDLASVVRGRIVALMTLDVKAFTEPTASGTCMFRPEPAPTRAGTIINGALRYKPVDGGAERLRDSDGTEYELVPVARRNERTLPLVDRIISDVEHTQDVSGIHSILVRSRGRLAGILCFDRDTDAFEVIERLGGTMCAGRGHASHALRRASEWLDKAAERLLDVRMSHTDDFERDAHDLATSLCDQSVLASVAARTVEKEIGR